MEAPLFPVGEYVAERAVSPQRRAEWIDVLETAPAALRSAVAGLSTAQLDTKYRDWTVRQIVHHLADSHMQSYARFKWTLTEDQPTIKPYDEGRWAALADSLTGDVRTSLALIEGLHGRWTSLLRSLSADDFQRTFYHPETGLTPSLDEALGYYAWHSRHHTGQIVWLRKARGWSSRRMNAEARERSRGKPWWVRRNIIMQRLIKVMSATSSTPYIQPEQPVRKSEPAADDLRQTLSHLFSESLHLDYDSALKADVEKQNFSTVPRYWYVDATMRCDWCGDEFCFTANEQKAWYEDYGFYVDAFPKRCKACRRELRDLNALRQEYDRDIAAVLMSDDCAWKARIAAIVDRLCESFDDLPAKIHENRKLLAKQIARRSRLTET